VKATKSFNLICLKCDTNQGISHFLAKEQKVNFYQDLYMYQQVFPDSLGKIVNSVVRLQKNNKYLISTNAI